MYEILRHLSAEARVLDLGCRSGSFDSRKFSFQTVRVDLDPAPLEGFIAADAAALPFRDASFDAAVSNHSLEHFERLDAALAELGRVLKREAGLFVAVPDASTLTDRLYRWLARGGGHLNAFRSAGELAARISRATGLPLTATRVLPTSFSFLNPRNRTAPAPRKLWLLAGGREPVLVGLNWLLRAADRLFGTRLSVYGWALYFGRAGEPVDERRIVNACARCGAGHPAAVLQRRWMVWACPGCEARNLFMPDPR